MPFRTQRLIQRVQKLPVLQTTDSFIKIPSQNPFIRHVFKENIDLISLLKSQKHLTSNDWKKAREDLLKIELINDKNVDSTIKNLCSTLNNEDAFTSYMQFLKSNNLEINLYLAGAYASSLKSKAPLSDSHKQEIYDLYDFVRKKYSILDTDSCNNFISALSVTDRWEESIELLEIMKISGRVSQNALNSIIESAFVHNKPEIGWKFLSLASEYRIALVPTAFTYYLEYCLRTFKDKELLEQNLIRMFTFCAETERLMHKDVLDDYLAIFRKLGYTYSDTTVNRQGKCQNCSHQLPAPKITEVEFNEMSKQFMEKVLIGDNVYHNSTPKEFKEFLKFIEKAVPYDIVIDGLNVACTGNITDTQKKSEQLTNVVSYFVNENKKILLLGRKHMLRWKNIAYLRHNTKMFLVDNSSYDDPNLLYATLYGGINTCFLSNDLMRQHKNRLPLKIQGLFKIWQLSHQYMFRKGIKYPVKFEIIMQKDKNGWHLPYFLGNTLIAKDSYESSINWVCLRRKCK